MFRAVGVKGQWKKKQKTNDYFFGKADVTLQAPCVKHAVCLLSEKGFNVVVVTCDGSYANQSTADFPHPDNSEKEISFIFDARHLLKCVRNCLGDLKVIRCRGQSREWKNIETLHRIQLQDDLNSSHKITHKHINHAKGKMNVRLAAQTLSNSVADAIDYLREDESHHDFVSNEEECQFIRNTDQLFDLCNSRNPLASGFRSKFNAKNLKSRITLFRKLSNYLMEIEDANVKLFLQGIRKRAEFLKVF